MLDPTEAILIGLPIVGVVLAVWAEAYWGTK